MPKGSYGKSRGMILRDSCFWCSRNGVATLACFASENWRLRLWCSHLRFGIIVSVVVLSLLIPGRAITAAVRYELRVKKIREIPHPEVLKPSSSRLIIELQDTGPEQPFFM